MNQTMKMEFAWSMPSKNTYDMKPIKALLKEEIVGFSIDPFANKSQLCDVNNDINGSLDHVVCHDALDFLKCHKTGEVDTVVFDPPYSPRQVSECYKAEGIEVSNLMTSGKFWADLRDEIARVVPVGGKVISFGWNSTGMGKKRGFEKTKILLVGHGGNHNDTIVTVETKIRGEATPEFKTKFVDIQDIHSKSEKCSCGILEVPRN